MKAKHWIVAGLLAFLIAVPCTMAQSVATVNIPYDFFVGSQMMPAGIYECSPGSQVGTLVLRRTDNPAPPSLSITVSTKEIPKDLKTIKFVFRREKGFEGNYRYVLQKVRISRSITPDAWTRGSREIGTETSYGRAPSIH